MFETIGRALGKLLSFDGRDSRAQFWPYAAFVLILTLLVSGLAVAPIITDTFARTERFAAEHPELATIQSGPGQYSIQIEGSHPELMPDVGLFVISIAVVLAGCIALLAAAVVRRLHDAGKSGLWGLLPLPFMAFALTMFPKVLGTFDAPTGPGVSLFLALFLNNLFYLGALAVLVAMLVAPTRSAS